MANLCLKLTIFMILPTLCSRLAILGQLVWPFFAILCLCHVLMSPAMLACYAGPDVWILGTGVSGSWGHAVVCLASALYGLSEQVFQLHQTV